MLPYGRGIVPGFGHIVPGFGHIVPGFEGGVHIVTGLGGGGGVA